MIPDDEEFYELQVDDEFQASASGPKADALAEIRHYASIYKDDGVCKIYRLTRQEISLDTGEPVT